METPPKVFALKVLLLCGCKIDEALCHFGHAFSAFA